MTLEGTIVDGQIVLESPAKLPNGTRVRIEPVDVGEDEVYEYPHPMAPYDREKEIALLRQSIEDAKHERGVEARAFLKQLAIERGLPLEPGE